MPADERAFCPTCGCPWNYHVVNGCSGPSRGEDGGDDKVVVITDYMPATEPGMRDGRAGAPAAGVPISGNGQERRSRARALGRLRAADIQGEAVSWLWAGRVPLGMVTVVAGFPGVGKSTLNYDLAARISREGKPVLVATAEDHLAAVVRPRLEAATADLDRVHLVTEGITLPDDVGRLRDAVAELEAALVIIDPLVAFIGDTVNTHRDHHVRRVLAPLAELAEGTGAAVLVVIHTNKGMDAEPLLRISGSIGFTGAARSVLLAAEDPQDDSRRILAVVKSNLAQFPAPLAYRLAGVSLEGGIETSRVEWLGEAPEVDVRALLARRDPEERTQLDEATDFLRESGVLETARAAKALEREAKGAGIATRTLQRARQRLAVPVWKDGYPGVWYWGPRPADPDSRSRQRHLGEMAGSTRPAETESTGPDLANGHGFGESLETP
jgi:putative DNA primase/helicase